MQMLFAKPEVHLPSKRNFEEEQKAHGSLDLGFGNYLLVGIHSDEDIETNKGPTVVPQPDRFVFHDLGKDSQSN